MTSRITFILFTMLLLGTMSCEKSKTELADDLYKQGNYKEAISAYTVYIENHPNDEKSLHNRGRAYEETGNLRKALQDFRKAVDVSPENIMLLKSLGLCYFKLEQYNSAINTMDDLIKRKPNDIDAFYMKGRALQELGKIKLAIENYSNAIRYNERHAESYLYRGMLWVLTKKSAKGCRDLKKAKSLGAEKAAGLVKKHCM